MFEDDCVVYYVCGIYEFVEGEIGLEDIEVCVKESSLYGGK